MQPAVRASFWAQAHYVVRPLEEDDINEEYVGWLNDPQTNRYLSSIRPGSTVTIASQRAYVRRILRSADNTIFGLFCADGRLVGTSGVQNLNLPDRSPWIGVLIGPKECRGLGLGTRLVWIVTHLLFSQFRVNKVYAGMLASNVPSYKAFLKAGYRREAANKRSNEPHPEGENPHAFVVSCSPGGLVTPETLGITAVRILGNGTENQGIGSEGPSDEGAVCRSD